MKLMLLILASLPLIFAALLPGGCPACKPPTCPQAEPFLCRCKFAAAQACYEQCGGPKPIEPDCTGSSIMKRAIPCGGPTHIACPKGLTCFPDPRALCPSDDDDMSCPGLCFQGPSIPPPPKVARAPRPRPTGALIRCGGLIGKPCPEGMQCVDDPRDDCDPSSGGADCMGVCVKGPEVPPPP